MALLEIAGLRAGYGDGDVLHGLSFAVARGEFLTVLGQNGSGKTTLLKAIQRLLPEVAGEVRLDQASVFGLGRRAIARMMAYVPQLAEVAFGFTVAEAVEMGRYAHQGRWAALSAPDAAAVEEALALTDIAALRDKQLAHLSGGERQRVFIARALAQDAPLLLLDEPSAHLDMHYQVEIYELLKSLQETQNKTVLAAEHNLNLAVPYSDRLLFLKDGRLAALGPPGELVTRDLVRDVFEAEVEVRANPFTGLPEVSLNPRPGAKS